MTARKFLLRVYLWFFVSAFVLFIFRLLISSRNVMYLMADERRDAIMNITGIYSILFLCFGLVYMFFKITRKRLKRALSNYHYFASLIAYVLLVITYAKMDVFGSVPKTVFSNNVGDSPVMESQTLINIVYTLFASAQVLFLINVYIAFMQKRMKDQWREKSTNGPGSQKSQLQVGNH